MSFPKNLTKWVLIPTLIVFLNPISLSLADSFTDVDVGDNHYIAISSLGEDGIINGYEDNSFRAYEEINRAEALKMITLASGIFSEEDFNVEITEDPFTDVPANEWYAPYISVAKDFGLISGYEDGTFRPGDNINLAETLKIYMECYPNMIYPDIESNMFADTDPNAWYAKYFAMARLREMLDIPLSGNAHPDQKMTRGYLAEILYRLKKFNEGYHFGKATFYGSAVQGSGTASGETFNMYEFTAAHTSLPFGTIVEVTNLANGKTVQVKINDRGPYGEGRVLDLSSSAFAEIASLGAGVINVQYKVVETP